MNNEELARKVIETIKSDPDAFAPGRRNDDTVDCIIAYHVLNRPWLQAWYEDFLWNDNFDFGKAEIDDYVERAGVVGDYLDSWDERGGELGALYFLIRDYE